MNSDKSIENNDDSEVSDYEIDHLSINHRPSSISFPMKDDIKLSKHSGLPEKPILQSSPVQLE